MIFLSSWDDGHPKDLRIAALLHERGLLGTFYVPLSNSEGRSVMDARHIRSLAHDGFEVASHTRDHVYLNRVAPSQWSAQIQAGKDGLEQIIGRAVTGFCYPGGQRPWGIERILQSSGISHARTVENLRMDLRFDRYAVPTTLQFYPHRRSTLLRNIVKTPTSVVDKISLIGLIPKGDNAMACIPAIASACARANGVFHLWGHSWEIDAMGAWSHLAETLDYIAALKPTCMTVDEFVHRQLAS